VKRLVCLLALVGCGRISFDARSDGAVDGQGPADVSADAADSALLVHASFETGIVDERGHTITCLGGCPFVTAGHVGAGSVFFNNGQCLEVADAPDLHPPVYTVMSWAAVFVPAQNAELFARPLNGATTSNDTFEAWVQPDSGVVLLANGVQSLTTGLDVTLWHHYAGVFDGGTLITYVDGAPIDTRPAGTTMYGPDPFLIGCDRDNAAEVAHVQGNFDDVRFYGRVLGATEIAAIAADHI
jgi:hypothetical protein